MVERVRPGHFIFSNYRTRYVHRVESERTGRLTLNCSASQRFRGLRPAHDHQPSSHAALFHSG